MLKTTTYLRFVKDRSRFEFEGETYLRQAALDSMGGKLACIHPTGCVEHLNADSTVNASWIDQDKIMAWKLERAKLKDVYKFDAIPPSYMSRPRDVSVFALEVGALFWYQGYIYQTTDNWDHENQQVECICLGRKNAREWFNDDFCPHVYYDKAVSL